MDFNLQKMHHPCWGLTGGIGSGKSTVARIWQKLQKIHLVDTDAIAHALTAPNGPALDAIRTHFGAEFIEPETGAMDRSKMRVLVFGNPQARRKLESLLHPLIYQQIQNEIQASINQGCTAALLDIPLLTESGFWRIALDAVVVVDCQEQTQIQRVQQRNQLDIPSIRKVIASQAKRTDRLAIADIVIHNDSITLEALEANIAHTASHLSKQQNTETQTIW